jgi:hypothetical protein
MGVDHSEAVALIQPQPFCGDEEDGVEENC